MFKCLSFSLAELFLIMTMHSLTDALAFLGDDLTLCEIEVADEGDIFVWNGVEVKRVDEMVSVVWGFLKVS